MNPIMINESENLNKARSLLHHCYLEHLEWEIAHNNPSGIKIQNKNNQTIISDDYDDLSIWFSVLNEGDCITCGRLCHDDANGLLEIERYPNAKKTLHNIFKRKNELNIVELNREATLPKFVNDEKPYLLLLKSIFEYCIEKKHAVLTTSNLPKWVDIYEKIGFQQLEGAAFKYFDSEPVPVTVYFADNSNIKDMCKKINNLLIRT